MSALSSLDHTRVLEHLRTALDYGVTAIKDLDRSCGGAAREDMVEVLTELRALRDLLSPDPRMEPPIGDEILQEWMS
jgi:hypothetical protein